MSDLDFRKQLIINEFKTLSKGRTTEEILPLLLAVNQKAKENGIAFTNEDIDTIIDQVGNNLSPKEKQLLPELLKIMGHKS